MVDNKSILSIGICQIRIKPVFLKSVLGVFMRFSP